MNVQKELFHACLSWATKQCEDGGDQQPSGVALRAALGDALFLIRFPSMSISEFTETVLPVGLLNMEEENTIYRVLNSSIHCSITPGKVQFPVKSRQTVLFECEIVYNNNFNRQSTSRIGLGSGFVHRSPWSITLAVDKDILISDVTFHGDYKGKVLLVQNGITKAEAQCDEPARRARFSSMVTVEPGSLILSSEGSYTYSGDYFSKPLLNQQPLVNSEDDDVKINVRDFSNFCFIKSINYSHNDQLQFFEQHFA